MHVRCIALLDQHARKVRPPHERRIAGMAHRVSVGVAHAQRLQRIGHAQRALVAAAAHAGQPLLKRGVARIDAEPDDVDGGAMPGDGDLDAVDETHALRARLLARFVESAQIVVIGERPQFDAIGRGARGERGRRQDAVGVAGVTVQIGIHNFGILAGGR